MHLLTELCPNISNLMWNHVYLQLVCKQQHGLCLHIVVHMLVINKGFQVVLNPSQYNNNQQDLKQNLHNLHYLMCHRWIIRMLDMLIIQVFKMMRAAQTHLSSLINEMASLLVKQQMLCMMFTI